MSVIDLHVLFIIRQFLFHSFQSKGKKQNSKNNVQFWKFFSIFLVGARWMLAANVNKFPFITNLIFLFFWQVIIAQLFKSVKHFHKSISSNIFRDYTTIVCRILIIKILSDEVTQFKIASFSSNVKWCISIDIPRIFFINNFN